MYEHAADPGQPCTIRAIENAGADGHLGIVQWLHEACGLQATLPAMRGSLDVAKYLYDHREGDECGASLLVNEVGIQCAAESSSIAYLGWVLALAHSSDGEDQRGDNFMLTRVDARSAEVVVMYNHWHVLQWLHDHQRIFCTPKSFRGAVGSGNITMIDWRAATTVGFGLGRTAAENGYLRTVQWLHAKEYPLTHFAMDLAAKFGFPDVVQWLHVNRKEGCTTQAMDDACAKGRLAIVQFLHHYRPEGCTMNAMDKAAAKGHLEVVRFLHESGRSGGCTTRAMDHAAWRGHLEIVQYLHFNRTK